MNPPEQSEVPTIAKSKVSRQHPQKDLQKVPRQRLAEMCSRPMRLRIDLHLRAPTIVRSKSQKDHRSQAQLSRACSCCQKDLQRLAAMLQADSNRRRGLLMVRVVLLLNQRGHRCLQVVRCLWQKHCFHCAQVSIL